MKKILMIATLLLTLHAAAQSDYDVSVDEKTGFTVFQGQISFEDLQKESSFTWFQKGVEKYKQDAEAIKFLKKHLPAYDLVVLLGTWCDDSHLLIPQLYKTLQAAGYPVEKLKLYGVNRAKEAKYIEHKLYRLTNVPTIILIKNDTEIGRVVETVKKSIEEDMMELIKNDVNE